MESTGTGTGYHYRYHIFSFFCDFSLKKLWKQILLLQKYDFYFFYFLIPVLISFTAPTHRVLVLLRFIGELFFMQECQYRVEGFYKLTEEEYSQLQYDIEQVAAKPIILWSRSRK